jgi:hypothetical protein
MPAVFDSTLYRPSSVGGLGAGLKWKSHDPVPDILGDILVVSVTARCEFAIDQFLKVR